MPTGNPSVPSLEDELLTRLLGPTTEAPPPDRLPPEEVFFDPVGRNIYSALHALYLRDGRIPGTRALLAELAGDADAVTRLARYQNAPEYPANCRRLGLGECVEQLTRRWRKERRRQLMREMVEAERRGDDARRIELLDEKRKLDHAHYRGVAPGAES